MSLAKVTFIKSVEVCRYGLCCCVAACGVCARYDGLGQPVVPCTHTTGSKLRCQTPTTHTKNICEPLREISVEHSSVIPDDGCCSILQTGHITLSSTSDQHLENHSTKYHRQQPLYNTLELLMIGIVVPETC